MAAITIRLNYNFGSSVQCCTLPLQAIRVVCETSLDRNVFREKLHVIPVDTGLEKPRRKKRICSYRYKTKIGAVFVLWFILIIKVFCNFSPSLALPTSWKIVVTKIPGTAQNSQFQKKNHKVFH